MTIRFHCTHCQRTIAADDRYAGARIKCPGCGKPVTVPTAEEAAPAAALAARARAGGAAATAAAQAPGPAGEEPAPLKVKGKGLGDGEIDMTPMIDCVFLLLIFFIVTASFKLQKSLEIPPPEKKEEAPQAKTIEQLENDENYVIVRIYKDNSITVDGEEAPSPQELLSKLREARSGSDGSPGPTGLMVLADGECRHETVVMALDMGTAAGMEDVRLATVDESDFW